MTLSKSLMLVKLKEIFRLSSLNRDFSTCLYIFEDVFRKKLSTSEFFFVNSHQIIELCTISDYQTKRF